MGNKIHFDINKDGDVAYVRLPAHLGKGKLNAVAKQVLLESLIDSYKGPEIYLDFNADGVIVGIEFLLD
jgi:uncharacterized protein YuzE